MSKLSIQVEKQVVMALTSIILLGSGCEDRMDTRGNQSISEGKPVDVTFRIGLADEADAYTLSGAPDSKASGPSGEASAFSYALCPANETKATASLKPDALYNLEIRQYNTPGTICLNSSTDFSASSTAVTGTLINTTLQTATHCQLVLVAWGKDNSTRLGTGALTKAQEVSVSNSYISAIDPSKQDDMNKMPYILHLTDVNVASDGSLYSADGEAIDIRLLLKRLAIRLNVDWTYNASVPGANYQLGQILLQSVPLDYKVVAAPDSNSNDTYPSLLDQFKTIQLSAAEISAGSYSCWLPANVRGTNPAATSLTYRIKSNAPTGSTYIDFQAINQKNTKQKLNYRVYLGSNDSYDFNLYGNRNYSYTVNFNHTALPINDLRISIIDPIPASQGNSNFVSTANCFMVAPGGSFCFNPYKYYVKGTVTNNGILRGWCSTAKIQSVKVLWQTKENGDVGDPVLGVVSSDTDHTNIVELNDGNDFEKARIYCRVAPNTTGGSGLIAAYDNSDGTGNILWSWHIWVTNYAPSATTDETVLSPANKRILKLSKSGTSFKPMMDRCLGAYEGYVDVPASIVDMSRANGFHYQRARKDPFPGSYPSEELPNQYKFTIDAGRPPKNCLNRYKPDGITWLIPSGLNMTSVHHAYQHPEAIGQPQSQEWSSNPGGDPDGRPTWSDNKTIHDPCPAGWRVPTTTELRVLINCNSSNWSAIVANSKAEGGVLLYYDETVNRTYMRFSGYPADLNILNNIGYTIFMATTASTAKGSSVFIAGRTGGIVDGSGGIKFATYDNRDAQNIRCIQDR